MKSSLKTLIAKETKEMLRDPRIFVLLIVAPMVIFILLGSVMGYATEKTVQSATLGLKVAVVDNDEGELSKAFVSFLKSFPNGTVELYPPGTQISSLLQKGSYDAVLVIPAGFSANISSGRGAIISSYENVRDLSISSTVKFSSLSSAVSAFQQQILMSLLSRAYPDMNATSLLHLVSLNETAVLGGKEYSLALVNSLLTGSIMLIVAPIMVFSIASSLAASSMGTEKEEKTLEILLSLPIKRTQILLSKVFGAFILSLIGMVGMGVGFYYYISSIFSKTGAGGLQLAGTLSILSPASIIAAGLGILLSLLFILAASIVIASLAGNVREAQAMASYAWLPILIPYILLMYIDLSQLSTSAVIAISLIPASTPLIALKASFQGWSTPIIVSFAANILCFAVILYLGARWFEGERILSARISRRKMKMKLR